jgi:hypothetical protein
MNPLLFVSSDYFFVSVGSSGTSADTNMESVPGGNGSRGATKA